MEKRPRLLPEFFGKRPATLAIDDSVRVLDGQTHVFRDGVVLLIAADEVTVRVEGSLVPIVVPMKSVKCQGADRDYADGSSGLGGGARQGSKSKRKKTAPAAAVQVSWSLDHVTKCYVKAVNGQTVASRATMVYDNSHVGTEGELLP